MQVRNQDKVYKPEGQQIPAQHSMTYLGTLLSDDGQISSQLGRRIGVAKSEFIALSKVWRHSALTRQRKLFLFSSLVESKLLYALSCACLTVAEQRRLNGFQVKCIRQIWGIKPSYWSRVSNVEVLRLAGHRSATTLLDLQQLQFLGRILRQPESRPLRAASFRKVGGVIQPGNSQFVRRVGRPRKEWVRTVLDIAYGITGGSEQLCAAASDANAWKRYLQSRL